MNQADPWISLLARRAEVPEAQIVALIDGDPDVLIDEVAALLLAWAQGEARKLGELKPTQKAAAFRKLRTSAAPEDRLALALYEAQRRAKARDE